MLGSDFDFLFATAYTPAMSDKPMPDDDQQRTDEVLLKMLRTPPKAHAPLKKKRKKPAK